MTRYLVVCTALALSACATSGPKVVKVPIPVTCATPMPTEPEYQTVAPEDGLFVRTQKLLVNEKLKTAYIAQLKAWGLGCNIAPAVITDMVDATTKAAAIPVDITSVAG